MTRRKIALIAIVAASAFSTIGLAQSFGFIEADGDLPGDDFGTPIAVPGSQTITQQRAWCKRACELNNSCMAYTWVSSEAAGTPTSRCFLKRAAGFAEQGHPRTIVRPDMRMRSGIKLLNARACWARHFLNAKVCNVFSAQNGVCPPGSRRATLTHNTATPGTAQTFCVALLSRDPGGLPNCTDAFGGPSNDSGVIGNRVNHACLDS